MTNRIDALKDENQRLKDKILSLKTGMCVVTVKDPYDAIARQNNIKRKGGRPQ